MPDFIRTVPTGDDREQLTCQDCGFVAYENPKVIVGSVVSVDGRILLCRRAIEPRHGFWTLPAGYMELAETVEEGAQREAWEEARARIAIEGVLAIYSIARIGQVQVIYHAAGRAGLRGRAGKPGGPAVGLGPGTTLPSPPSIGRCGSGGRWRGGRSARRR